MKINDKIFETIVGIVFFFVLNLGVSSLCMLFLNIRFNDCLFYSIINATWMPLLSPGFLSKIKSIEYNNQSK
jgi:hypothetical protein